MLEHPVTPPEGDDYFRVAGAIGTFLSSLTAAERQQIHNDLEEVEGNAGLYPVSEMLWASSGPTTSAREEE